MQFYVMPRTHVWQFTLVHVAKSNSTLSLIMSSYFPHWLVWRQQYVHRHETIDTTVPLPNECVFRCFNEIPIIQRVGLISARWVNYVRQSCVPTTRFHHQSIVSLKTNTPSDWPMTRIDSFYFAPRHKVILAIPTHLARHVWRNVTECHRLQCSSVT